MKSTADKKQSRLPFRYKVFRDGKMIKDTRTGTSRRFLSRLKAIKFTESTVVFIKVSYGVKIDIHGKLSEYTNEGEYNNRGDLLHAAQVFASEQWL